MNVLLTGGDSFTGKYIKELLRYKKIDFYELKSDLRNPKSLDHELSEIDFTDVIHLAGLSSITAPNIKSYYDINSTGTLNLLEICKGKNIAKFIFASTANMYGGTEKIISESTPVSIKNHYSMSKYLAENIFKLYKDFFKVIIVRPFNYTGVGQSNKFVIPKIIEHFVKQKKTINLGNIDVFREFNDVRYVSQCYIDLLESDKQIDVVNICSGNVYSIRQVLDILYKITNHSINVKIDNKLFRKNEIELLKGDPGCINKIIKCKNYSFTDTLSWMLSEHGIQNNI